jgi:hypothetical protein
MLAAERVSGEGVARSGVDNCVCLCGVCLDLRFKYLHDGESEEPAESEGLDGSEETDGEGV